MTNEDNTQVKRNQNIPVTPTPSPALTVVAAIRNFNFYLLSRGVSEAERGHVITDISSQYTDDAEFVAALVNAMATDAALAEAS